MKKEYPRLGQHLAHILLCLLAAAVAVAAIGVGDALESRFAARVDMSFNSVTTESETTKAVLRKLTRDVHAYAVYSDGNELVDLSALLDRYQATTPHFTWSRESLSRNPLLLQWASDDLSDSSVTTDCLIIRCEETGRTRVLTWDSYIGFGYNTETGIYEFTGLTYEKSLTEAILNVTSDELPRVQLLSGHGELTESETSVLTQKLRSANYEVSRVSLRSGEALDVSAPLMVLSPTMDVTEDELAQLMSFVQAGGSLFVTVDFTDPDSLPNLYAFYRLYGVQPLPGVVVAQESDRSSYYSTVAELTPTLNSTDATDVLLAGEADYFILAPARALEITGTQSADLLIDVVLQSGEGAYIRTAEGEYVDLAYHEGDRTGPFALAVLCNRAWSDGTRSRAFFIGNSGMFLSETLYNMTYSNELLLQIMQHLQGSAPIDLDIVARDAARPQLNAVGNIGAVLLLALPPLIIAVLAVAVLRPRRYL